MTNAKDEISALRAEVAELKNALSGKEDKPPPKKEFKEESDAEWRDRMHQMRERQANLWMPPSAIQEMAGHPCNQVMAGVIRDRHAPTSPGMISRSEQPSDVRGNVPGSGTGWAHEVPIGPPPGIQHVDAQLIADEVRQRAELKRKLGE
jgi:hypothetical protein